LDHSKPLISALGQERPKYCRGREAKPEGVLSYSAQASRTSYNRHFCGGGAAKAR